MRLPPISTAALPRVMQPRSRANGDDPQANRICLAEVLVCTLVGAGSQFSTLVADATYPHLYRVVYPDGWKSTSGNLLRAKDAAYGHARHLLGPESPSEAPQRPEREAA